MGTDKVAGKVYAVLDSNALLQIYRGVGLFEQIEESLDVKPIYVCPEDIESRGGELSRAARLALEVATGICSELKTGEKSGDNSVIKAALELQEEGSKVLVVTSDRELRKRLRTLGIKTVYYRESQHRFEVEVKDVL
jgi:rRNA-processing protein FCF1